MQSITTELFRFFTPADPATVWTMLTSQSDTPFYGMTAASDWEVGSAIELRLAGGPRILGEVLAHEPGTRLSYTLGDRSDEPSAYVTWELRPAYNGSSVRLYVDEVNAGDGDASDEVELAWLPVVAALQSELERCAR